MDNEVDVSLTATFSSVDAYMEDFIKTLQNFCQKSPAQPKIEWMKGATQVYVFPRFDPENPIIISVNTMEDKKKQIRDIKNKLEKTYPVIFSKKFFQYRPDEIENMIEKEGVSIKEALERRKIVYLPRYRVLRVHHRYNEMDCYDFKTKSIVKFKMTLPLVSFLDTLYEEGNSTEKGKEKINELFFTNRKFLFAIKKGNERE